MGEVIEKISKTITDAGKVVTEKTKNIGEVAKLNAKIVSSEHTISENYTLLGKYCYDKCKDNPTEGAAEYINAITAALNSIDEVKAQLLSIKGAVKCTACGCECPMEDNFCGKCGAALIKPEPSTDIETVDDADVTVEETPKDDE